MSDGGPAFPIPAVRGEGFTAYPQRDGMSLRAWIAGHALAGMTATPGRDLSDAVAIAIVVVALADAVIARLGV
jgi:hypothetical protein